MKQVIVILTLICSLFAVQLYAQDFITNKEGSNYKFKVVNDIETNEVQNQSNTATCWSFSALSFMESELMRMGKGKHKLSEMYIVRMAYEEKADRYVRMHGEINFAQGGAFHDIPYVIRKFGIVPESVYQGLNYGSEKHNHGELEAVLKAVCDAVIKNKQGKLTTSWKKAISAILDAYLGPVPAEFDYDGKKYTPMSFASRLGLNMDDYVVITSFTHHPFYTQFIFDVPDNWAMGMAYNVPLDVMMEVIDHSMDNGYSVAWAADVSEKGFSFRNGLAIVPEDESKLTMTGKDNAHFSEAGAERSGNQFTDPDSEKEISQEMRQEGYDNYATTDDHGMHITGVVEDQNGTRYYKVKNSWGTSNDSKGYIYASESYVRFKTLNVMVHKDALTKSVRKKLHI